MERENTEIPSAKWISRKTVLSGKNMMRLHLMTFIQLKDLVQIVNKFNSNLLF